MDNTEAIGIGERTIFMLVNNMYIGPIGNFHDERSILRPDLTMKQHYVHIIYIYIFT